MKTGLNILLGDDNKSRSSLNTSIQKTNIELNLIEVNSEQPRKTFDRRGGKLKTQRIWIGLIEPDRLPLSF